MPPVSPAPAQQQAVRRRLAAVAAATTPRGRLASPVHHMPAVPAAGPPVQHSRQRAVSPHPQLRAESTAADGAHEDAATDEDDAAAAFAAGVQQLAAWQARHGSCYVPSSAADAAPLRRWVAAARRAAADGRLTQPQRQQLEALGFVWKPNVVDAKWHHNYHTLRCWLASDGNAANSLEQGLELAALPASSSTQHSSSGDEQDQQQEQQLEQQLEQQPEQQPEQQQLEPLPPEVQEAVAWLQRQVELYAKLKLTPLKTQMLRRLGVRLRRQAGLTKTNLHSVLQGPDSPEAAGKRRPIVVNAVTGQGKRAVGRILAAARQQQQQQEVPGAPHEQQQQQLCSELPPGPGCSDAADVAFMCRLAELQSWRKRHGTCCVPLDVFDAPQLSHWVASLRAAQAAAVDAAEAEAAEAAAGDCAGSTQQQEPQQQQEQLPGWQRRELDAVGFLWRANQEQEAWHGRYHQLRHYKLTHCRLPALPPPPPDEQPPVTSGQGAAAAADEQRWRGLAAWLQQQCAAAAAGRLSRERTRKLRALGVGLPRAPPTNV